MGSSTTKNASDVHTPALLVILDGFGVAPDGSGNSISLAKKPFMDELFSGKRFPVRTIEASGLDVGLPKGQMGNSEVGHLNMGSGRIIYQELTKIDKAISDGTFFSNDVFCNVMDDVAEAGTTLHLLGLLSDGGVHSEQSHLEALIQMAAKHGVKHVLVHGFLDGRDVSPTSGVGYLKRLEIFIADINSTTKTQVAIGSVGGRYYGMDRDNRWDRVKRAWDSIVVPKLDEATICDMKPSQAVEASYASDVTDEFVAPTTFVRQGVRDGDGVIFFNFRPDRAREMTRAFTDEGFDSFERGIVPKVEYVCMTEYDETFDLPVAFPKEFPDLVLADYISQSGYKQLHIAETEKYAHVTFFFNGGVEKQKDGESRILIQSPKVATYDLQPEMSAYEVNAALMKSLNAGEADFYIVNFANCDMVGHTGSIPAATKAVEVIDECLSKLIPLLIDLGGVGIVTADHGNAEKMISDDGSPHTAHTTNPVPIVAIDASGDGRKLAFRDGAGRLADIAPTLLDLAGLPKPDIWSGESLLV